MVLPSERCLSMAAFLAFLELRAYKKDTGEVSTAEAIDSLKRLKPSAHGLDYCAGVVLRELLDDDFSWDGTQSGVRRFVFELVHFAKPWWLATVPHGRASVKVALTRDERQCFRQAGLLDDVPDEDAIRWWDSLAALVRSEEETDRMVRARRAEQWSLEYERMRLRHRRIDREPEWTALEDNQVGYDILSYERHGSVILPRLIEVKSTLADTIVLTRNEWRNASSSPQRTVFHVWQIENRQLYVYSVEDIRRSVPTDGYCGQWLNVRIMLSMDESCRRPV